MTKTQAALLQAVLDHPHQAQAIIAWAKKHPQQLRELVRGGSAVRLSAAHAPKGGVTVAGQHFTGGQFIPGDVMAKASPAERAAVAGGSSAEGGSGGSGDASGKDWSKGLSPEARTPEGRSRVRKLLGSAKEVAKAGALEAMKFFGTNATDVLLEAADFSKISFAGGKGAHDPVAETLGVGANDALLIASHVLGRAALWAKRKITKNPEARLSLAGGTPEAPEAPDVGAMADFVLKLLRDIHQAWGLDLPLPDRESVMVRLADRLHGSAGGSGEGD